MCVEIGANRPDRLQYIQLCVCVIDVNDYENRCKSTYATDPSERTKTTVSRSGQFNNIWRRSSLHERIYCHRMRLKYRSRGTFWVEQKMHCSFDSFTNDSKRTCIMWSEVEVIDKKHNRQMTTGQMQPPTIGNVRNKCACDLQGVVRKWRRKGRLYY